MDAPIVEQNLVINSYESDLNANIKAVSLQNLLQEVAYRGSEFCHCGPSETSPPDIANGTGAMSQCSLIVDVSSSQSAG